MIAAAGAQVPMISGRGLGHTGGTLDKLEAIPGFRVDLPLRRFERLVREHGFALIGQTKDLAPADRKLYALRDVTGTVESIPLITASILSKKLCEDLDALVLDVKVGRGAFMKSLADARALAASIVSVGSAAGLAVTAVLTRMDAPLGRAIGNALETREALELLHGRAPDDLLQCTLALGQEMLLACKLAKTPGAAERRLLGTLKDGRALRAMRGLVRAQGGDPRVVDEPDRLPRAPRSVVVRAKRAGYVRNIDALALGQLAVTIGAGRARADQAVDPRVGIVLERKPGERVQAQDALATLHLANQKGEREAVDAVARAFELGTRARIAPLVVEVQRGRARR
jgi:pyrimidine-nucleoside phosphorylase